MRKELAADITHLGGQPVLNSTPPNCLQTLQSKSEPFEYDELSKLGEEQCVLPSLSRQHLETRLIN